MYTLGVSADRRYHLQSEEANRAVDALLEQLRVPEGQWRLYSEMLTTVLKLYEDGAGVVDLKITSAALKELRYGYKVFAPWRSVPKVTVFGSARTPADHPVSQQAHAFGKRMTSAGWMVMTGAGSGVMGSISGCPSSRRPIPGSWLTRSSSPSSIFSPASSSSSAKLRPWRTFPAASAPPTRPSRP